VGVRNGYTGLMVGVSLVVSDVTVASASTPNPSPFGNPVVIVLKLFLFLGVIIALAVLSIRFLAKKTQVVQKGAIQVLAARQVAPNKSVQVIEIQGKRYLIGVGDQISLLADVTQEFDAAADEVVEVAPVSFGKVLSDSLAALRNQYKSPRSDSEGK
jgi:flagellar protein FliO/FliZ